MTDMIKAQREQLARIALDNSDLLDELFARLESSSRRERQNAAATLSAVASFDPQAVFSHRCIRQCPSIVLRRKRDGNLSRC